MTTSPTEADAEFVRAAMHLSQMSPYTLAEACGALRAAMTTSAERSVIKAAKRWRAAWPGWMPESVTEAEDRALGAAVDALNAAARAVPTE